MQASLKNPEKLFACVFGVLLRVRACCAYSMIAYRKGRICFQLLNIFAIGKAEVRTDIHKVGERL